MYRKKREKRVEKRERNKWLGITYAHVEEEGDVCCRIKYYTTSPSTNPYSSPPEQQDFYLKTHGTVPISITTSRRAGLLHRSIVIIPQFSLSPYYIKKGHHGNCIFLPPLAALLSINSSSNDIFIYISFSSFSSGRAPDSFDLWRLPWQPWKGSGWYMEKSWGPWKNQELYTLLGDWQTRKGSQLAGGRVRYPSLNSSSSSSIANLLLLDSFTDVQRAKGIISII